MNRNAQRSRSLIRKAFTELIKTKNVEDITVTEIINLADINRATFYAHYNTVRDIGDEIEDEIISKLKEVLSSFRLDSFSKNPTQILLQISTYLNEDIEYYRTLITASEANSFLNKLQQILVSYMESDPNIPEETRLMKAFRLRIYYVAGGIVNAYTQWFKGNLACTIFDIPLELSRIIINQP